MPWQFTPAVVRAAFANRSRESAALELLAYTGNMIEIARVYGDTRGQSPKSARYLVERLWPRGMKKESLQLDGWLKEVAPSQALRKWFGHQRGRWPQFRERYLAELRAHPDLWQPLLHAARRGNITLLYSARDTEHNSAIILRDFLVSEMRR